VHPGGAIVGAEHGRRQIAQARHEDRRFQGRNELTTDVGTSPFIETRHVKILAAAKEATAGQTDDWLKAQAIYDWVREHVKYKTGELKGAARALADKEGDTDELVSLFIAMCRAQKIPARTVFELDHCHAEFYLEDAKGKGHWFPCQPAGARTTSGPWPTGRWPRGPTTRTP